MEQKCKFNKLLRKLHIGMHFLHALGEMPKFSLYLKGHLKHKKKLDDVSRVVLNEECFMVLHKSCPPKIGEPGSFFIPCQVGDLDFQNALADLGTSINVMSLYVADKLFLPPLTPTMMSIQFVDGSIKYTKGTVDNVFVQDSKLKGLSSRWISWCWT